jgi:hypothetical protein
MAADGIRGELSALGALLTVCGRVRRTFLVKAHAAPRQLAQTY